METTQSEGECVDGLEKRMSLRSAGKSSPRESATGLFLLAALKLRSQIGDHLKGSSRRALFAN
jgi:hypothetical protein